MPSKRVTRQETLEREKKREGSTIDGRSRARIRIRVWQIVVLRDANFQVTIFGQSLANLEKKKWILASSNILKLCKFFSFLLNNKENFIKYFFKIKLRSSYFLIYSRVSKSLPNKVENGNVFSEWKKRDSNLESLQEKFVQNSLIAFKNPHANDTLYIALYIESKLAMGTSCSWDQTIPALSNPFLNI